MKVPVLRGLELGDRRIEEDKAQRQELKAVSIFCRSEWIELFETKGQSQGL